MSNTPSPGAPAPGKTYISDMPLTGRHLWIVFVASFGQMIGTCVVTVVGVVIPLLNIVLHPELSSAMQGLIGAADLMGIVLGSVVFGRLSDRYGYITFFRLCPALVLVASLIAIFIPHVAVMTVSLFFMGLGIGGEYSLDSDYVSELMPQRWRSLMVGVTKAGAALGNIVAAGLCLLFLTLDPDPANWSRLLWIIAGVAALMLLLRIRFYQSPKWLADQGRMAEAEKAAQEFLGPKAEVKPGDDSSVARGPKRQSLVSFVRQNWRQVVLSGVPWACEGLGVYGIGVFLPILVMALGLEHFTPGEAEIIHVTDSVRITLYISCIILPGFLLGLLLIKRGGGIVAIQSWGFWLCAASLVVLMLSYHLHWNKWVSIGAFMAFELFLNMGPHLITYVLPPRIYPVADRGQGVGLAASIGKIGAVIGVFFIPVLLKAGGAMLVLAVSIAVMAIGAVVTMAFGSLVPPDKSQSGQQGDPAK